MFNIISDSIISGNFRIYLAAILIFVGIQIFFYLCLKLCRRSVRFIKNEALAHLLKLNLHSLNWLFCYALAVKFSLNLLVYLDPQVLDGALDLSAWLDNISFIILSYFTIIIVQQWSIYLFKIFVEKNQKDGEKFDADGLGLITTLIRFVVWIIGLIIVLKNFDIRGIDTLITSLGITGIAVAFALQNILSEIFASFSIFLDKPFIVGDYVEIGDDKGVIQRIGLRSTRIRSLSGEEIVVSNKELVSTRIHNFKLLKTRRVSFDLMLDLKTPLEKLKQVPKIVEKIIITQPKTKFERVTFMQIGEAKLRFEVVYHVLSSDYQNFTRAQDEINFEILEEFDNQGIMLIVI